MRDRAAELLAELGQVPVTHRELFMELERAKIRLDGHRVVYWTEDGACGALEIAHSVPYCNVAFLLLGPGCSVSTEAMELLAAANVVVGFVGGETSPLHAGVEPIAFASGQSEYRPTHYMQAWARWWFHDAERAVKAIELLHFRANLIEEVWSSRVIQQIFADRQLAPPNPEAFFQASLAGAAPSSDPQTARKGLALHVKKPGRATDILLATAQTYAQVHFSGTTTEALLGQEGQHVKRLYRFLAGHTATSFEGRDPQGLDTVNQLLTMGNYVAYGLAATALHGLGISFSFAVLHGKTRRGALVFDIADPVKDAVVAPIAFACARAGDDKDAFRRTLKKALQDLQVLAKTMKMVKRLAV